MNTNSYNVFWVTGLSGCGKTTFAKILKQECDRNNYHTIFIDGDIIRDILGNTKAYDAASRLQTSYQYARLCRFLVSQQTYVICATISLFHEIQAWNRQHIPGYVEIFLDRPIETLTQQDNKNLYHQALSGNINNVVGVDIIAEYPKNPDYHLKNIDLDDYHFHAKKIIDML